MLLHILRKDAREHWLVILLANAVIVGNGLFAERLARMHTAWIELLGFAVWAIAVARLVQSEPIPGERQYWLTRPIPRGVLLSAKVLGTVLFLHVPHLIGDSLALASAGFNPLANLGGLLLKQVLAFATWTMPLLVLAVITRTLVQYTVSLIAVLVAVVLSASLMWQVDFNWMGLHWTKGLLERAAMLAIGAAILWLQYFERRTKVSRILAGAAAGLIAMIAIFSPWSVAYAIQQRINPARMNGQILQPVFDAKGTVPLDAPYYLPQKREVNVMLPITWSGLPEGVELIPDRTVATIRLPNGEVLRPTPRTSWNLFWRSGMKWASFQVHEDLLAKAGTQNVDVDLQMYVTVYGAGRTYFMAAASPNGEVVPEVGRCYGGREPHGFILRCWSALKNTGLAMARIRDRLPGDDLVWKRLNFTTSYAPLPTELSVGNPFTTASVPLDGIPVDSKAQVEFLVREPVAHLEVPMSVRGVKLSDYAVRR